MNGTGFLRVKNKNLDIGGLTGVKYVQQKVNSSGLACCIYLASDYLVGYLMTFNLSS